MCLYDLGQVSSPLGASELASGGTSLVVQWLRLHHFTAGGASSNPHRGKLRFRLLHSTAKEKELASGLSNGFRKYKDQ